MSRHGASTSRSPQVPELSEITQVNDSLYELYKPPGTPRLQILFFHGLQLDNYSDAHLSTWKSADKSCVWPQKWLVEDFPDVHVLTVSYSVAIEKSSQVTMDMLNVGENLVCDLLQYNIGQTPYCPVILVGHSLGGIVIKEVLRQAHHQLNNFSQGIPREKLKKFLDNVRGVFFYATPHHGSDYAKTLANNINGPLLTFFKTLSIEAARLNQEFNDICKFHERWLFANVGETLPTQLPTIKGLFEDVWIVPEASSRGDNFNLVDGVDHFSISKPRAKTSRNFYKLKEFLADIDNDVKDVHKCEGLPCHSIGLEKRVAEVHEKLTNAQVLGIVGMGGIGKTTLAKQVFNSISREFEYTCFLDNVKDIAMHELKNSLLDNFYENGRKIDSSNASWPDLMGQLKLKKTLIVMDDVDDESQLNVLPRLESFGARSRLIMTTRDEGIFSVFESYNLYRVDFLDSTQGEKLFCKYAGLEEILDSPGKDKLKKNVKVVVEKCGGLPLTLEVLGCHLRGHADDVTYWEQTIDKFGKGEPIRGGRNDRVWDTLRVSYDSLARKEQKMFIEAATYFFEEPLERALAAWNGAYRNAESRWANLVSRSIVKVFSVEDKNGFEYKTVWVHEQLRDLATSLLKDYVVSEIGDDGKVGLLIDCLNGKEVDVNTKIVRLWLGFWDSPRTIPLDFLVKLKKLKYLDLIHCRPGGSFQSFPRKLSLLRWSFRHGTRSVFPRIRHNELSNLAVLELESWEIPKEFPEALGNLTNLRILYLSDLRGFDHLPENFGNLSQLKQLRLSRLDLQRLPASLGLLVALEELDLWLDRLKCLPSSISQLQALKILDIYGENLETLPDSLGLLTSLQRLDISCDNLRSLPDSLGELAQLKYLDLSANKVKALPATMGQLFALRYMEFQSAVDFLPESFGQLSSLRTLRIDCENLKELPKSFGKLGLLEDVFIRSNRLESLPEIMGQLSQIRKLVIRSQSLNSLPTSIGKLSAIRSLEISCTILEKLPDSIGDLCLLETLELNAWSLVSIPESTGRLSALTDFTIESESLRNLPASLGQLCALQTLELTCGNLEKLPGTFGDLCSLKRLNLRARSLVSIPESTGRLSALTDFTIESESLRNLPASFGQLCALQTLELTCGNLEKLPGTFGDLCTLKRLELRARSLVSIPESTGRLSSLADLTILSDSLRNLPSSFGQLSGLQTLRIRCGSLEKLPDSLGNLSSLETLKIRGRSLVSIAESVGQLSSLKHLDLNASTLRNLPTSIGQLSWLRKVEIECDHLEKLPDSFGDLYSLEKLIIRENGLKSFQESLDRLPSLGWVLWSGQRISLPRRRRKFLANLNPCAGLLLERPVLSSELMSRAPLEYRKIECGRPDPRGV